MYLAFVNVQVLPSYVPGNDRETSSYQDRPYYFFSKIQTLKYSISINSYQHRDDVISCVYFFRYDLEG